MKYGALLINYGDRAACFPGYNLGDPIQIIALEQIYQTMGIDRQQIAYVSLCDLANYSGEYVLLPMCGVAIGVSFAPLPLSPKIIPVFISAHIVSSELSSEAVDYLRNFQPIGCRDEYSLNTMRRYGIQAYLSGCLTVVIPRRTVTPGEKKVLLIDAPEALTSAMPETLRNQAEYMTHLLPLPKKEMTEQEARALHQEAFDRFIYYRDNATLIISSRMHAIVPALAMGIPVIAAFENISYRFSWLDKYLPLFTTNSFDTINWSPQPVEFEERKQRITALACNVIQKAYEKYAAIYELSDYYENRQKSQYGSRFVELIRTMHTFMPPKFQYLIWGCGLIGASCLQIMKQEFPEAELIAAIDNYVEGIWRDVPVIKPSALDECRYQDAFILLAAYSAKEESYERMKQLKRQENRDFIYLATQNG